MRRLSLVMLLASLVSTAAPQDPNSWLADLPHAKDYVQKRVSSYDRSGGNADNRQIAPGETPHAAGGCGSRADQSYVVHHRD